jgi:hypothetical protein
MKPLLCYAFFLQYLCIYYLSNNLVYLNVHNFSSTDRNVKIANSNVISSIYQKKLLYLNNRIKFCNIILSYQNIIITYLFCFSLIFIYFFNFFPAYYIKIRDIDSCILTYKSHSNNKLVL